MFKNQKDKSIFPICVPLDKSFNICHFLYSFIPKANLLINCQSFPDCFLENENLKRYAYIRVPGARGLESEFVFSCSPLDPSCKAEAWSEGVTRSAVGIREFSHPGLLDLFLMMSFGF